MDDQTTIRASDGSDIIVDAADYMLLSRYSWNPHSRGYVFGWIPSLGKKELMHRFLTGAKAGQVVDHVNFDRRDNRRANLRVTQNGANVHRQSSIRAVSGFRGVRAHRGRWTAQIMHRGKCYYLGMFDTPEAAAVARDAKAVELYGAMAGLNGERRNG